MSPKRLAPHASNDFDASHVPSRLICFQPSSPEEMDWLRALPPEQQAQGWEELWRRRDPTPDTPRNEVQLEFFRRVRYAERHFQGFGPGWRTAAV